MLKPINLILGFNLDVERELSQLAARWKERERCELGQLALHHGPFSVPCFTRFGVVCLFKLGHCPPRWRLASDLEQEQFYLDKSRIRMSLLDGIGLVVLGVVVVFLYRKLEERILRRTSAALPPGRSFDAAQVCKRIQRVRGDYLAVIYARGHDRDHRKQRHEQICRSLRSRSYFRRSELEVHDPA